MGRRMRRSMYSGTCIVKRQVGGWRRLVIRNSKDCKEELIAEMQYNANELSINFGNLIPETAGKRIRRHRRWFAALARVLVFQTSERVPRRPQALWEEHRRGLPHVWLQQ